MCWPCLVYVLVNTASLPEHVRAADLTSVLLLVDHGAAVLCGVVLYYIYIINVLYLYYNIYIIIHIYINLHIVLFTIFF